MQILVCTVHTVQQTVFWGRLSCSCCCAATDALVGERRKLWCSAVAVELGARNAWFDYGYMFCIIQCGFWKNFTTFLVTGWTARRQQRQWFAYPGFACDAPRAVFQMFPAFFSSALELHLEICTLFLRALCIFSIFRSRNFALVDFFGALEHSQL